MRVLAALVAIALLGGTHPAGAEPFTFVFHGTFDHVTLPGAEPDFDLRVTIDNGGQTPVGTFHLGDWVHYEVVTGTYVQVWDPAAGGTSSSCGQWTCLEINSDGIAAQLVLCSGDGIIGPDDAGFCGAQDNASPPFQDACLRGTCGPTGFMPSLEVISGSDVGVVWAPFNLVLEGVIAGQAPDCSAAQASLAELWPPDHRMVAVRIADVVDPDGDPVTLEITGVTSDEPVDGARNGGTCPDAVVDGDRVLLRAERVGGGNGRVYTVHFTATDPSGLSCNSSVDVCVPHDRRHSFNCIKDDAVTVDATSCSTEEPKRVSASNARVWISRGSGSDLGMSFSMPNSGPVELAIYDLRGRRVRLLVRQDFTAGDHTIWWNGLDSTGREVAEGVYLVRLMAGGSVRTAKVTWLHY